MVGHDLCCPAVTTVLYIVLKLKNILTTYTYNKKYA